MKNSHSLYSFGVMKNTSEEERQFALKYALESSQILYFKRNLFSKIISHVVRHGLVVRISGSHTRVPRWPGFDSRCRKSFMWIELTIMLWLSKDVYVENWRYQREQTRNDVFRYDGLSFWDVITTATTKRSRRGNDFSNKVPDNINNRKKWEKVRGRECVFVRERQISITN